MKENHCPSNKNRILLFLITISILFFAESSYAQFSNYISSVETDEAIDGIAVKVTANFIQTANVSSIVLAYRNFSETEYTESELSITGLSATGIIPGKHVKIPLVEYFLIIMQFHYHLKKRN